MEVEKDGKIPFLDILVIRNLDGTVFTDWYMKPTASGRILSYYYILHVIGSITDIFKNLNDESEV